MNINTDNLPTIDINSSQDSHVWKDGKLLLDCFGQFGSQALGWNNHDIAEHTKQWSEQLLNQKIANSDVDTDIYKEFRAAFKSITPDFKYHFFIDGGALAVENALKVAFDWKQQKLGRTDKWAMPDSLNVVALQNAFHGRSGYTMSLTNTTPDKTARFPQWFWPKVKAEKSSIEWAFKQRQNIAALILEPIQCEGGDIHLDKELLEFARQICDEKDALLIFDEVQTGFGATGKWWCYEHFNVKPDILCFGKKAQVCGIAVNERIEENSSHPFNTAGRINSTWGGNLIDMARSTAIINIVKERNLLKSVEEIGAELIDRLKEIAKTWGSILNVRGRGLIFAFDLPTTEQRDIFFSLLNKMVWCLKCGTKSIRFRPALTFNQQDMKKLFNIIEYTIIDESIYQYEKR